MGMAASQARLLSITARLSNNELEQQSIAHSKQRLSDNSEQINDTYLEALNKTKYQVLTGYNNSEATYADLTYNQITGSGSVAAGKQYIVKDNKGKVLVSNKLAEAFKKGNGDFNVFLSSMGYTQSNIDVTKHTSSEEAIHEAWDKYLVSVDKSIDNIDGQHIFSFDYNAFSNNNYDGYVTYETAYTTDEAGEKVNLFKDSNGYYLERYALEARVITDENGNNQTVVGFQTEAQAKKGEWTDVQGVEYNTETQEFTYTNQNNDKVNTSALYASPNETLISEDYKNYLSVTTTQGSYTSQGGVTYDVTKEAKVLNFEGSTTAQRELFDYATSITEAYYNNSTFQNGSASSNLKYDKEMVTYYKNIFNEMKTKGFITTPDEANFKENEWFVRQLKAGKLTLSYYSSAEKGFVGTSIDDDGSIAQREDKSAMNIAEQIYKNSMDRIQNQDKQYDLQLKRLDSEHSALQTEYESVKGIIKKNVEKSFNIFNA